MKNYCPYKEEYRIDSSPIHWESSNGYFPGQDKKNILSPFRWFSFPCQSGGILSNSDLTQMFGEGFVLPH